MNSFKLRLTSLLVLLVVAAAPQAGLADLASRDHPHVRKAFREAISEARQSTVRVLCDGKATVLGVIADNDGKHGLAITKASELKGKLAVRTYNNNEFKADVVAIDGENDLALLKLKIGDQSMPDAINWRKDVPRVGSFLATTGLGEFPLAVGVVSTKPRKIAHQRGFLGVGLDVADLGARITEVIPESAAFGAGLKVDDVVTHVNDKPVGAPDVMIRLISRLRPGDEVSLRVQRADDEMIYKVRLGTPEMNGDRADRFTRMNALGGKLSTRRAGFSNALQHDTVLRPDQCGGPIVDLDGKAVGINIARAGRVNSYALPAEVVKQLVAKYKK